jgi:PPOX class probable F420-dependent enzyme
VPLPDAVLDLLQGASPCVITTLLPDGAPHATEVWVDVDGDQVLVNSVDTHQKVRNVRRDPRVALVVIDPEDTSRHAALRGTVAEVTTEGARDHIEKLAQRYTGGPYPWWGGREQIRVLLRIDVEKVGGQLR